MIRASCHCGAVVVEVDSPPVEVTDCHCSICRRYGTLWAYYRARDVHIVGGAGATHGYSWGRQSLRFVRCGRCGCVTHWEHVRPTAKSYMGVNARNFDPAALGPVRIRLLDGADTWKYLD